MDCQWEKDEVIQRLTEYLKIPSVQPDVDYGDCIKFIEKQASEIGLPIKVHELVTKKPVAVLTLEGSRPDLPSIMLNSHMDVVPVTANAWKYPPFEAHIEDGWIYARGTQDMKAQGMAYLEAIRRLKGSGIRLKRTLHVTFVPDEEIGGEFGMATFTKSEEFRKLNVGFELDESGPSPLPDSLYSFNGEKICRQMKFTCTGPPGHGAFLQTGTAGEKISYIIDKFAKYREQQRMRLKHPTALGDVTTVNLTMLEGGTEANVVPDSLSAYFDIRITPDEDLNEFQTMIDTWCTEAGEGVSYEYLLKNPLIPVTDIKNSPFYDALTKAVNEMGYKLKCAVCPGTTDARYVRQQGIPAISLTPFMDTPILLHSHNEKIHVNTYKIGINVTQKILEYVANV